MEECAVSVALPLSNGYKIPALGFGTWQAPPGQVAASLKDAVRFGFRHIDCAMAYANEREIGQALAELIESKVVARSDLFITSKLWCSDHRPEAVARACRETLADLKVDYLDLYLIHWPVSFKNLPGLPHNSSQRLFPENDVGGMHMDSVPLEVTWAAMEKLVDEKLVRSIGVSNFSEAEIKHILGHARIRPVTNQIEVHVLLPQLELRKANEQAGLVTTAYCPFGVGTHDPGKGLMHHPKIKAIAEQAKISPAQLLLRWNIQSGNVVLTKSVTSSRIQESANTPYGRLDAKIMSELDKLGKELSLRVCNPQILAEVPQLYFTDAPSSPTW